MWSNDGQCYNVFSFVVDNERDCLKSVLLEDMGVSIRMICNLKRFGEVLLNGKSAKMHQRVSVGDVVVLRLCEESNEYLSQKVAFEVLYEDLDLLLVNKGSDIVVHPTKSHLEGTLLNFVKAYFEKNDIRSKVRFVNRLDRDTTGLVIVAKNQFAHSVLTRENSMWDMEKVYVAFVHGIMKDNSGIINLPIGKVADGDIRRQVFDGGQEAITHYRVLREFCGDIRGDYSMVEVRLQTGRTHQIRAHFAHLGHSLLGDVLYGGKTYFIPRQALHCSMLSFQSPRKGKVSITAPLPPDMQSLIDSYTDSYKI